ncbi:hypothetical protein NCTGTJJY_CDS0253 [Serratia phage 92A1]|nr:hypothetical protein NCTGTJJY_CDS0253 [Serratia phage 92A1]
MIIRTDMNSPGDILHQVKIELKTDNYRNKIQAVVYPNYEDRIKLVLNSAGVGFSLSRDQTRDLIEVLQATLRACE